jgi:pSer/pThr/pTyr-binding forkhead associated (FHA) protein
MADTNKCSFCGFENRIGVLFCEDCGSPLTSSRPSTSTRAIPVLSQEPTLEELQSIIQSPIPGTRPTTRPSGSTIGMFLFKPGQQLWLQIEEAAQPLIVHPTIGVDLTVGRHDLEEPYMPDVDLMPYNALDKGISRRHASLVCSGNRIQIMDLQSSNGTHLNGIRLPPHEPHEIRDSDELRFGNLQMTVHFR